MAALQALTGGLTPPNEDMEFLKGVGIVSTTTAPTTTTPYTSGKTIGAGSMDPAHAGILQAIQALDTKVTNGFAQIMGKMANKPVSMGGGAENSQGNIDMENSTMTQERSFFNKIANGARNLAKKTTNAVGLTRNTNTRMNGNSGNITRTLVGGRKRRGKKGTRRRRRH